MRPHRTLIHVVAAVVEDASGRVLITRRPPGKYLEGRWEFPGGKRIVGESREDALARELREELDLQVDAARPLIRYRHDYPDLSVDLDVWRVQSWTGEPRSMEGQAMDWAYPSEMMQHDLLPADRPVTTALGLPDRCLVTGAFDGQPDFDRRLEVALAGGVRLVQLRMPGADPGTLEALALRAARLCRRFGSRLLINGDPATAARIAETTGADGVQIPSRHIEGLVRRPVSRETLCGISCHDRRELEAAVEADADFAVLGSVLPTVSHPGSTTLGWSGFQDLVADLPLPVYAIGGMTEAALPDAWRAGAQGIAAITAFW